MREKSPQNEWAVRKSFTIITGIILFSFVCPNVCTQQSRVAERVAEWNQYLLPQSTFVREVDASRVLLFEVPFDWNRQKPDELVFKGPKGATLSVIVQKIPDGLPLRDYVSDLMRQLSRVPDSADSMVVRRTAMSALEAREIMFESSDGTEELTRSVIWSTVSGPNALSLILAVPVANVAEIEPYFKAVVQSVILVDNNNYADFDALRSSVIKDTKPKRVDEIQSLAFSLTALDSSGRQANITRLAEIFALSPDTAIDLALDRRPAVRTAAFEAIALSRNNSLEKFLLRALEDREPIVAERAARSIARIPNVIDLLRDHSSEWLNIEPVARVWPFLTRSNQGRILRDIFEKPGVTAARAGRLVPKVNTSPGVPKVTVQETVSPQGSPPPPVVIGAHSFTEDSRRQLNGLTLTRDFPLSEFKIPLTSILAAKNDAVTILALQMVWSRRELLPVAELLNLLSSSNSEVSRLAALNLGQSGSVADIKSIEDFLTRPAASGGSTPSVADDSLKHPEAGSPLNNELQLTIRKIRFRQELSITSGEARQLLLKKNLADPRLSEWVWYRFSREFADREGTAVEAKSLPASPVRVLPLGENLFPKDVTYYAALPEPEAMVDKFVSALDGLQLESARSQANLVLILSFWREQLAQQLDSPPDVSPIVYSGINTKEPIALASWYTQGAPLGIASAERKAIIMRVTDRTRFERSLTLYQRSIGNFAGLTDYFSGGVRLLTVLPAILPLSAKAMFGPSLAPAKEAPLLSYIFVGETEWNGYSIKVVEQRKVEPSGHMTRDAAYFTYLGDTAVMAPDLESLREMLTRVSSEQETLATNSNFKQVAQNPGEAIYLSNVTQLFATPSDSDFSRGDDVVSESGALKISNSTWQNLYQIQFTQRVWLKPFIPFQPEELASPRELLPRTTLAYFFMNFDSVIAWRDWSKQLFVPKQRRDFSSIWAIDFEKEVLPELGPECGVAVMELPNILGDNIGVPVVAFFKLKSDKLARALEEGKLLIGSSAGPGPTQIKLESSDLFVMVKGRFLILSNRLAGITALDQKEKLASSRDFSRAAKAAPAGEVAFGGYNLEAAVAAIGDSGTDPVKTQRLSLITSIANAFHSPNFYATATSDAVEGRFSLSMDREGRFSLSELASLSKEYRLTYALVEARGVPVHNQERLSSLKLIIRATAAGEIDRLVEDVRSPYQLAEKISDKELKLTVRPRHSEPKTTLTLPIKGAEFVPYLQPGNEFRSNDKAVLEKARSIVGDERDAWKVARMLADWTYKNLKWKRVDYATASETLATLEADCSEFSELYIAMARSLGLPARGVSGLAYSGTVFGGHAWVEVYVGDWIELDPTWGTDFVDATHIRNSADGTLLTYAALNLVELEVLEAPRGVAEFQKDPRALAEKLCQELPKNNLTALTSALDLAVLTNESTGLGTWDTLSVSEREAMSSAFQRVVFETGTAFGNDANDGRDLRLLKIKESGDRAEAVLIWPEFDDVLVKIRFVRSNGAWFLVEVLLANSDLHIISETFKPTIDTILNRRNNKPARSQRNSEFVRALLVLEKDPKAAIAIVDQALKDDPKNTRLRNLKALALIHDGKPEDAIQLWKELAGEPVPFAPALYFLARQYDGEEDAEKKRMAIEFLIRYGELEPEDPRTHVALARLYDESGDDLHAEAEHMAALKSDPLNTLQFVDFAAFLAVRKRFDEAASIIDEANKNGPTEDDLFGNVMIQLYYASDTTVSEEFARSQPQRMRKSALANLHLGYAHLRDGKTRLAMSLFEKAATLRKNWSEPYAALAGGYRILENWPAALNAADTSIQIDVKNSDAHFSRACALARMGRINEALESLEKAVELDASLSEIIGEEDDLKVLASQPAFRKLLDGQEHKP